MTYSFMWFIRLKPHLPLTGIFATKFMHNLDDFGGWCRGEMRQRLSPAGKHTFSFVLLNIETVGAVTPQVDIQ